MLAKNHTQIKEYTLDSKIVYKNYKLKPGDIGHQGDVFIKMVSDKILPSKGKLKPLIEGCNVLQNSSRGGHYHFFLKDSKVKVFITEEKDNVVHMEIQVLEPTTLVHGYLDGSDADHDAIDFPVGSYVASTQRESLGGMERRVID